MTSFGPGRGSPGHAPTADGSSPSGLRERLEVRGAEDRPAPTAVDDGDALHRELATCVLPQQVPLGVDRLPAVRAARDRGIRGRDGRGVAHRRVFILVILQEVCAAASGTPPEDLTNRWARVAGVKCPWGCRRTCGVARRPP